MGLASTSAGGVGIGFDGVSSMPGASTSLHSTFGLSAMQTSHVISSAIDDGAIDAIACVFNLLAGVGVCSEGRPRSVSLSSVETDDNDQEQGGAEGSSRSRSRKGAANSTFSSGTSPK